MIREFCNEDMESVLEIWLKASTQAHDFVGREFWASKLDDMRNLYIPSSETFVFECGGAVKGFFSLHGNTLAAIFVSPHCQGEGVGRALIEKAKTLRQGIMLNVYKANQRSVQFYRRCGFREVAEKIDPLTGHAELVMEYSTLAET